LWEGRPRPDIDARLQPPIGPGAGVLRSYSMGLRISLYVVAAMLLGAHFLRAGDLVMVALCLAAPLLFLWRRRWSLMLLQLLAYGAAGRWLIIAVFLVWDRQ